MNTGTLYRTARNRYPSCPNHWRSSLAAGKGKRMGSDLPKVARARRRPANDSLRDRCRACRWIEHILIVVGYMAAFGEKGTS